MRILTTSLAAALLFTATGCAELLYDDVNPSQTAANAKAAEAKAIESQPVETPNNPNAVAAAAAPAAPAAAPKPKQMTEAEILGYVRTANSSEVAMSALAKKQGAKGDVKSFASMLATSHGADAKKEADLEKKSSLKGDEAAADAASLKSDSDALVAKLSSAKGKEFEKAFVEGQIAVHTQMLDAIDQKLAPAAQSDDVKTYVTTMRATVADHLAKAQEIQKKQATAATAPTKSEKKAKSK